MRKLLLAALTLSCLVTAFSCIPREDPSVVKVSSITLDRKSISLGIGGITALNATVSPADATDKTLIWTSSNTRVASIHEGVVAGHTEGTATITVASKDGGATATCKVTVTGKRIEVESITLDKTEVSVAVGETVRLTASVYPPNASDRTVIWSCDKGAVATVTGGVVTGIGVGTAVITAVAGSFSATCTVTVTPSAVEVTSVTLDHSTLTLVEGEMSLLSATVLPVDATDKTVTWSSSNEKVVTVSNGIVTAVAKGSATVTAAAGSHSDKCVVRVVENVAVESVTLNYESLSMLIGGSYTLTATVKPDNAAHKDVKWSTSNPRVVSVTNGVLKGLAAGTSVITASVGSCSASCLVSVQEIKVKSITLDKTSLTMTPGQKETLQVNFNPYNTSYKTVTWTTSNSDAATVSNGIVTAVAPGTAIITARSADATATCTVTVVQPEPEPEPE